MKHRIAARLGALVMAFALLCTAAMPAFAAYDLPVTPSTSGESFYLKNLATGEVLLDENSTTQRYIASTTKMMTALLLLESGESLDTVITIPDRLTQEFSDIQAANGADMGLKIGEEISLRDLLYGLLLPSANDAASVIADYLCGVDAEDYQTRVDAFVDKMNARAAELGCTNTHYSCPHGLYDQNNYSTAQDLALIGAACYANPTYMEVADTPTYTVAANNMHEEARELQTTNFMIDPSNSDYRAELRGIKTGFTSLANRCYVTVAEYEGHSYILVILGAKKENKGDASYMNAEVNGILDWLFARYEQRTLMSTDSVVASVPLHGGYEEDTVQLYASEEISANVYADAVITVETDLPDSLDAPLDEGEVIGTATVYEDGQELQTVDLITNRKYESAMLKGSLNAILLLPVLAVLLFLLTVLTLSARRAKNPRRRKKMR